MLLERTNFWFGTVHVMYVTQVNFWEKAEVSGKEVIDTFLFAVLLFIAPYLIGFSLRLFTS